MVQWRTPKIGLCSNTVGFPRSRSSDVCTADPALWTPGGRGLLFEPRERLRRKQRGRMPIKTPAEYHARAEQARDLADWMRDPRLAETLRRVAADYDMMAEQAADMTRLPTPPFLASAFSAYAWSHTSMTFLMFGSVTICSMNLSAS